MYAQATGSYGTPQLSRGAPLFLALAVGLRGGAAACLGGAELVLREVADEDVPMALSPPALPPRSLEFLAGPLVGGASPVARKRASRRGTSPASVSASERTQKELEVVSSEGVSMVQEGVDADAVLDACERPKCRHENETTRAACETCG